jgi:hypothetical protein
MAFVYLLVAWLADGNQVRACVRAAVPSRTQMMYLQFRVLELAIAVLADMPIAGEDIGYFIFGYTHRFFLSVVGGIGLSLVC